MKHTTTSNAALNGLDACQVWDMDNAFRSLQQRGLADSKRTAERRIQQLNLLPAELAPEILTDERQQPLQQKVLAYALDQARKKRERILFVQIQPLPGGQPCLHANDARGARFWLPLPEQYNDTEVHNALSQLQQHIGKTVAIFGHAAMTRILRQLPEHHAIRNYPFVYPTPLEEQLAKQYTSADSDHLPMSPHLKRLEAESIRIIREAAAEAQNPAMLYSIGKDSGVMLHLARKAFYPAKPPFPLLHIDTCWKFQDMYLFRDYIAKNSGMELLVYTNPEVVEKNINPFDHGSSLHTDISKTEALKQALDKYEFDLVFGGARRDEEKSRAKERIFSLRNKGHRWEPRNQRPELWQLYNTQKNPGESIRVFPLSNWTEQDIWQYIYQQKIPMVPLYFAQLRPVVVRNDMLLMVDDDRCQLMPGEKIELRQIRFRTLGCYPLTGAVESQADSLEKILLETIHSRQSERQGRKIDTDSSGAMEKKKKEGYF